MEIQLRTDRHVRGADELVSFVGFEVVTGLGPCAPRISSVQVQLTAESGVGGGAAGLRCLLEVRPRGPAPLAVMRCAATTDAAVRGAVDDMRHVLERMFRRIDHRHPS